METIEDRNRLHDYVYVYPNYLDKNVKVAEGRKNNLERSITNPRIDEIANAISKILELPCKLEFKHYAQDWLKRGRVKVELKKEGKLINEKINNKNKLLRETGIILNMHREKLEQEKEKNVEENTEEDNTNNKKKKRYKNNK